MNLRSLLLKTRKLSDFLRWRSKLFHSVMVDGKKELLKKLSFVFGRGMLRTFRVEYNELLVGIKKFVAFHRTILIQRTWRRADIAKVGEELRQRDFPKKFQIFSMLVIQCSSDLPDEVAQRSSIKWLFCKTPFCTVYDDTS